MTRRYYLKFEGQPPIDITHLGVFTLGRNGDIKVLGRNVSRIHCTIDCQNFPVLITDGDGVTQSKNGTNVNDKLYRATSIIESERSTFLSHNDLISIGGIEIRFLSFDDDNDSDINATK